MSKFPVYETLAIDAAPLCQHNKIPRNIETVFCQAKPIRLEDKTRLKKIGACTTCKECKARGIPICECWWKPDILRQHLEDARLLRKCSIFSIAEQEKQIHERHEDFRNNDYWGRANATKNHCKNSTIVDKFRQSYRKSRNFWLKPKAVLAGESVTWIMKPQPEIRTSKDELREKCVAKQMRTVDNTSKNMHKSSMDMYNLDPIKSFLAKIQNQRVAGKTANQNITLPKTNKTQDQNRTNETMLFPPAKADWQKVLKDFQANNTETKEPLIKEKEEIVQPAEEKTSIEIVNKNSEENMAANPLNKTNNKSKLTKNVTIKAETPKNNIQEQQTGGQKNSNKCKKSFVLAKTKTKIPIRAHQSQRFSKAKTKSFSNKVETDIRYKNSPTNKQDKSKDTEKPKQSKALFKASLANTSQSSGTSQTLENEKHYNSLEEPREGKAIKIKSKTQCYVSKTSRSDKNSPNSSQGSVKQQQRATKDNRTQSCVNKNQKRNQASDALGPQLPTKRTNNTPQNVKDHKIQSGVVNKNLKSNQVPNDFTVVPTQTTPHNTKQTNLPQNVKDPRTQSSANKSLKTKQISKVPLVAPPQTYIKPQINAKIKHFKEYKKSLSKIKSSHKVNLRIVKTSTESLAKNLSKPKNDIVLKYFKEKEPQKPAKPAQYPLIHSILQQYPKHLLPVVYYPEFENGKSGSGFQKPTKNDMHIKTSPLKGPAIIEFFDMQNKNKSPQISKDMNMTYNNSPKTKILPTKTKNETAAAATTHTTTSTCYSKTLEKLTTFGKYQKPKLTKSRISFKPLQKGPQTNINQLLQNVIHKAYETEFRSKRYPKNDH